MNLRRRINSEPIQLQLAPMIDVVMFLLCFFLLTWNLSRYEQDIAVKVPTARHGEPPAQLPGEIILNLRQDGSVELERSTVSIDELKAKLSSIQQVYPDQPVILRGAEEVPYKFVVKVLDTCRAARLTNIFFSVNPEKGAAGG
jgi:biopolymer transport protein ExbD